MRGYSRQERLIHSAFHSKLLANGVLAWVSSTTTAIHTLQASHSHLIAILVTFNQYMHYPVHVHVRVKKRITLIAGTKYVFLLSAVRLGRCPKKDKPSRFNLFKLTTSKNPESVDSDKQYRTEELILKLHESFRRANIKFDESISRYQGCQVC